MRRHGAPQVAQQPCADVPARTHGSTSLGGNVAKWASGYGCVAIVQTLRFMRTIETPGCGAFASRAAASRLTSSACVSPWSVAAWSIASCADALPAHPATPLPENLRVLVP